jgi:hypothetical protein
MSTHLAIEITTGCGERIFYGLNVYVRVWLCICVCI